MALALSRRQYPETKIMILGRWKSNAFMSYIRPQVLELTSNLAEDMTDVSGTDLSEKRPKRTQKERPRRTEEEEIPQETMELRLDY